MITDEQMITALKTVRQYCKEHRDCNKCVFNKVCTHCDYEEYIEPMFWELPGDDTDSQSSRANRDI